MYGILEIIAVFSMADFPTIKLLFIHHRPCFFVSVQYDFMKKMGFSFRMNVHLEIWMKIRDHLFDYSSFSSFR